jgi:hypothetical protein
VPESAKGRRFISKRNQKKQDLADNTATIEES